MTRKDYIALAAAFRATMPTLSINEKNAQGFYAQHFNDCNEVADVLARDNPKFDRARFLKACGLQ